MFILGYKLSDYQQTQITGSLSTRIIAVGHKLLFKWYVLTNQMQRVIPV